MIKASSSKAIDTLIADLSSESAVKRDAAVARLTVIGARAVERLIQVAGSGKHSAVARAAAFRSLEGITEPRTLPAALAALNDGDPSIVVAALNTTRPFLATPRGVGALDRVIEIALDGRRPVLVRVAAIHALRALPESSVKPILEALGSDPNAEIANALQPASRRAATNPAERLQHAAEGMLPADAATLKSAIARSSEGITVSTLHRIVEQVRVREGADGSDRRTAWMAARAAAHLALAQRGSRLALYDLRDTIESARDRLPVEFFAAMSTIGDSTCLEPIATAYSRAKDDWSRRQLADAFRAIVDREHITRRHAAGKKIEKRWPGAWAMLVRPQ